MSDRRKVLITGAAGRIGTFYRVHLGDRYELRLIDSRPIPDPGPFESIVGDIADLQTMLRACAGMDSVLHLAADPRTSAEFYRDLLEPNIKGVYNLFRAAKDQHCSRVIFASSVNSVSGYPLLRQVRTEDAPLPGNVYGATKAFGEALAAYFAHVESLSTIAVRIGWVVRLDQLNSDHRGNLQMVVTPADLCQLFDRCIETPDILHAVVHGVSNNAHLRLDLDSTRSLLGYEPQ